MSFCLCGCGRVCKVGRKYIHGHNRMFQKAENNPEWTGGRKQHMKDGHIQVRAEGHRRAKRAGYYVFEHIIVYENHHKCCVLPWGAIHHKNEIRDDNRIENLEGMSIGRHNALHGHTRTKYNDPKCSICGSTTTSVRQGKYVQRHNWYPNPNNPDLATCSKCYIREYSHMRFSR